MTLIDITERRELDELKDHFVSTVSHELRTPLTSIRGALSILVDEMAGPLSGQVSEFVTMAERNAQRLENLINNILDLQRIEDGSADSPTFSAVMAKEIFDAAIEDTAFLAQEKSVDVETRYGGYDSVISADAAQLSRCFSNLISNAIKASPEWGQIEVFCSLQADEVTFGVRDHGPGVPAHIQSRIFQRFVRESQSGTGGSGLGLSIARSIVLRHAGTIDYETGANGSTFFFSVPRARAAPGPGLLNRSARSSAGP